jgi:Flp pilus assembly protein TadG
MCLASIGFLAVAIDAGYVFRARRMAQNAADAASLAAAEELAQGDTTNELNAAKSIAAINGFDTTLATNPATVSLTTPSSGNFSGSKYVQATVSRPIHTGFLAAFSSNFANMTVSATAIAGGANSSPTCVCLQGSSATDLTMSNGSKISAASCGIVDNSTSSQAIVMYGGASVNALSLGTVSSTWDNSTNISQGASISSSTKIVQGIANGCSPTLPAAPTYSSCQADPGGSNGTFTFGPSTAGGTVCYTSLTVGANNSIDTLTPGIYVISGGYLHFESGNSGHSNLGGNGVFFYLANGASLTIDNGANVNLVAGGATTSKGATATSTGAYDGILIYQPASNSSALTVAGGANSYISGSLLAPSAAVTLNNGSSTTITAGIVAQTLTMSGGGELIPSTTTPQGSLVLTSPKVVQ